MYLEQLVTDKGEIVAHLTGQRPVGAGIATEYAERVARLEIWCSTCTDEGSDFSEFRGYDRDGQPAVFARIPGY